MQRHKDHSLLKNVNGSSRNKSTNFCLEPIYGLCDLITHSVYDSARDLFAICGTTSVTRDPSAWNFFHDLGISALAFGS